MYKSEFQVVQYFNFSFPECEENLWQRFPGSEDGLRGDSKEWMLRLAGSEWCREDNNIQNDDRRWASDIRTGFPQ